MNVKKREIITSSIFLFLSMVLPITGSSYGEEAKSDVIDKRYGLGAILGKSYDPTHDIDLYMLSVSLLYDYERIWRHGAPEPLRFKVEYSVGAAREKKMRLIASLNMFALYYLDFLNGDIIKPYVEGGIGIIYTDFQVRGQGLKINFNPQMGIGAEFNSSSKGAYFLSLRLHHISNGGIDDDNRGVNSALMIFGRYF